MKEKNVGGGVWHAWREIRAVFWWGVPEENTTLERPRHNLKDNIRRILLKLNRGCALDDDISGLVHLTGRCKTFDEFCFVGRAALYNLVNKANLVHNIS